MLDRSHVTAIMDVFSYNEAKKNGKTILTGLMRVDASKRDAFITMSGKRGGVCGALPRRTEHPRP